jgi:hypothetical protein
LTTDGAVVTRQPDGSFALEELPAGLGAPEWGDIVGTLSAQTDLSAALAGKANTSHSHAIADTTGLQSALDGKAATSHTHTTSQVTGLDTALAGKANTSHSHAIADTTGLQSALDGKAATSHTHTIANVTSLQTTLDNLQKQIAPAITNDRYFSSYAGQTTSVRAMVANRLFFVPLVIPNAITATRIGINVTTAVAGSARVGLYNDAAGIPSGAALLDAGTVNTGTTGEKEITISQALTPGLYWIAIVTDNTCSVTAEALGQGANVPNLGSLTGVGGAITCCYQTHTFGALPTVGSLTWEPTKLPPRIWIRTP